MTAVCCCPLLSLTCLYSPQTQPLCHVSDLGLVTAVCCGPLTSADHNCLAAISGNGWIHIFEVDQTGVRHRRDQRIPANVKVGRDAGLLTSGTLPVPSPCRDRR